MFLRITGKYRNTGLLILRVGLGIMLMLHGGPKIFGGPEKWAVVGEATRYVGIDSAPIFFGFMAGFAEFFGGFFISIGLYFMPALVLLILNLIVAAASHIGQGQGLMGASHAIELGIVFFSLFFTGPGRYSVDEWIYRSKRFRR